MKTLKWYYDRIEVSEGIDTLKTCESRERDICHFWYFLNENFKYDNNFVNNGCHDLSMFPCELKNIFKVQIEENNYCFYILGVTEEAISI